MSAKLSRRHSGNGLRIALAAAGLVGLALVVVVVIRLNTHNPDTADTTQRTAQDRCEAEVRSRLAAPSTAKLSNATVAVGALDPDGKDLFTLMHDRLKGVDHSRIKVWDVSVVVDAPNEVGGMLHDLFDCRAYSVDGNVVDTLVLSAHDH